MSILPSPQGQNPKLPSIPQNVQQILNVLGIPALKKKIDPQKSSEVTKNLMVRQNIGGFFFDAVFKVDHENILEITQHPVQTGANITDHSFMQPKTLIFDIGMSDANAEIVSGQYDATVSKSVSAYETLKYLQESRIPVSIFTRLGSYKNMLIKQISVSDDLKTAFGLRATVHLQQIIVVDVATVKVSSRPQTTGASDKGPQQPVPIPKKRVSILEQIRRGTQASG